MRGSMGGTVPGPQKSPKDTEGFPSGREAACGTEETRASEPEGLGSNPSSAIHLNSNNNNNSSHLGSITIGQALS